ncbi:hypothetical protein D3C78_1578840 [compost metagenome]
MSNGQQFFDRINHRHLVTAGFQKARHDGDREFFSPANQCCIDAVRALAEQTDAVQNMLDLCKFLLNKSF